MHPSRSLPAHSRRLEILPLTAARRGRPPIGFGLRVADGLAIEHPEAANQPLARCSEHVGGRLIGVLELDVVSARMVVDPTGALTDLAVAALERLRAGGAARARPPTPFELDDGVHGVRMHADLLRDRAGAPPPLPYVTIVALAGPSVRGGLLVTARAATADWEAGEQMLESIALLDRDRGGGRGGLVMPLAPR